MDEKVLIVDDDFKLRSLLQDYLEGYGYRVATLPDGLHLAETVRADGPDLVILDIMLPHRDGLDLLKDLRAVSMAPVIMLTAKGEDADRIVGLELGADDYLAKPFNPRELLARMKAVLRRSGPEKAREEPEAVPETALVSGGLRLSPDRRLLLVEGNDVELSATEFKILAALMQRPGMVLTRDELMNLARGRDSAAFDRSIDVHISNLRAKLKPYPEQARRIRTVWGTGYKLVE
jgi:two-component system phosphate regulon response regulator OmpR